MCRLFAHWNHIASVTALEGKLKDFARNQYLNHFAKGTGNFGGMCRLNQLWTQYKRPGLKKTKTSAGVFGCSWREEDIKKELEMAYLHFFWPTCML